MDTGHMMLPPRISTVIVNIYITEAEVNNRRQTDCTHQGDTNATPVVSYPCLSSRCISEEMCKPPDLHAPVGFSA